MMPPFTVNSDYESSLNFLPVRLTKKDVCVLLRLSLNELRMYTIEDKEFPKPIKNGITKQAAVYYDYHEILQWHQIQLSKRK